MRIASITANPDGALTVVRYDGASGGFDVRPYFELDAFEELRDGAEFAKVRNGGTFVEWECGADLSADTIEARTPWTVGAREASEGLASSSRDRGRTLRSELLHVTPTDDRIAASHAAFSWIPGRPGLGGRYDARSSPRAAQ